MSYWKYMAPFYNFIMQSKSPLYDDVALRSRQWIGKNDDVLEIACGSGNFSFRLAGAARTWRGTDISPEMIRYARRRPLPECLWFETVDAAALPYASNHFHAVFAANIMHLLPPDVAATVLSEIRRVVKPGKPMILPTFMHRHQDKRRFEHLWLKGFSVFGPEVHGRWTIDEFCRYLESQSLQILEATLIPQAAFDMAFVVAKAEG